MKKAFLESIKMLYPDGPRDPGGGVNKYQWRDIIRIYSMGWADSLQALDTPEARNAAAKWIEEMRPIADWNWWPDDSWRWW